MKSATVFAMLLLVVLGAPASATVTVRASPIPPSQVSTTAQVNVGLEVRGETSGKLLTVGGGYTLICEGQVNGSIEAERSVSQTNLFYPGITLDVMVPETTPTRYVIQGWNSWQAGSVHECSFKYRGRAVEASTSVTGGGYGFTFGTTSGVLDSTDANTAQFVMIKPTLHPGGGPPGGGCEPFCTCTP